MAAGMVPVRVTGLNELRKAFRAAGTNAFERHMRNAGERVADLVLERARPNVAGESSTTAAAMSAAKTATGVKIRVNRGQAPMAAGVLFGAYHDRVRVGPKRGRYHGFNQFPNWMQGPDGGPYFIWPEVNEVREQIADEYLDAIGEFLDMMGVPK